MTISSRTPEGIPHRCPICGKDATLDSSFPGGDSTCPSCGHLLWWFRDRLGGASGLAANLIGLESTLLNDLGADSLDRVKLMLEFEEEYGVKIPDEEIEDLQTVGDVMRYMIEHRGETDVSEPTNV